MFTNINLKKTGACDGWKKKNWLGNLDNTNMANGSEIGVISKQLAQGDRARSTGSGQWSMDHSLRVTEQEPHTQGDGARSTRSG